MMSYFLLAICCLLQYTAAQVESPEQSLSFIDPTADTFNITWKTVFDGSYFYLQGEINTKMIRAEFKKGAELRVSLNFDVDN